MKQKAPILFQYFEYRQFLVDFIDFKKNINKKYSYRYFSSRSGFSSTNFLSMVVKGKRNLTTNSISKIAKGLGLNKQERAYFEDLVLMNQAKEHEQKDYYYQRMLCSKPFKKIRQLSKSSYDYFSNWYNPVIREMIQFVPPPMDTELMASLIRPRIKESQVKDAIALLLKLNLIEKKSKGTYQKADAVLTTGDEIQSLQIVNFHKSMMNLAEKAIAEISAKDRDISGLVLSIDHRNMKAIKQKISTFRRELVEMASNETGENQVIYVQIHAFPLMQPYEEK
jgi:uncharacterized protein (TIGR02147 family)